MATEVNRYYSYAHESRLKAGINVIMHLDGGGGVYNMTCFFARTLQRTNIPFCIVPINSGGLLSPDYQDLACMLSPQPLYPTNLWSIGIPFLEANYAAWKEWFHRRYNINLTTWELPSFPERLHANFKLVDEIWTVSEFNQRTLQQATKKPVKLINFGLHIPVDFGLFYSRDHFNLPRDKVLFLINFEFTSSRVRKDPERAIKAFELAAGKISQDIALVMHVRFNHLHGAEGKKLYDAFKQDIRNSANAIYIIDIDNMPYAQQIGLKRACDCYVSLHRSEGYGLSCAEMADVGNWVIMTGFSGNLEILHNPRWQEKLRTVDFQKVPVTADDYPWVEAGEEKFQFWAEADINAAADAIVEVYHAVKDSKPL